MKPSEMASNQILGGKNVKIDSQTTDMDDKDKSYVVREGVCEWHYRNYRVAKLKNMGIIFVYSIIIKM